MRSRPTPGFSLRAFEVSAFSALKVGVDNLPAALSLLEKLMLDVMYDAPNCGDVLTVHVTRAAVLGEARPLIRRKQDKAAA